MDIGTLITIAVAVTPLIIGALAGYVRLQSKVAYLQAELDEAKERFDTHIADSGDVKERLVRIETTLTHIQRILEK